MGNSLRSRRSVAPAPSLRLSDHPRRRQLYLAIFVLTLLILALLALRAEPTILSEELITLERASLSAALPSGEAQEVTLPHRCRPDPETWVCSRTYHLIYRNVSRLEGAQLYLPRFSGTVRISLNGTLLVDSHPLQSSLLIGASAALLVPLPADLLVPGDNELAIDVHSRHLFGGYLSPLYIGPEEIIRAHYNVARVTQWTLPRLIDGAILAMGTFLFLIGLRRPNEQVYLVFGAILLLFAASSLPAIWPEAGESLGRFANVCRLAAASLLLPFVCCFLGRRPPLPLPAFLLLPLCALVCVFVLPGEVGGWILRFLLVPAVLVLGLAAIAVLVAAAVTRRGDEVLLLLASGIVAAIFAVHDLLVFNGLLESHRILLSRFNVPLLMLVVGGVLIWRLATALAIAERFNTRLSEAVVSAEKKLQESFARRQAEERRAALEAERMRLMRDLHDGLGGQLVSILSLSEVSKGERSKEIIEACQRALTDLRLMVNSLEDVGNDLGLMFGMFRERIEPQLRAARISLDWRARSLPPLPGLSPAVTLAIFRILQEAVTNAVRHSGCTRLTIEAEPLLQEGYGVRLKVGDNGRGGAALRPGGLGLASMEQRSTAIGARLLVESGADGTVILLDLPRRI